MKKGKERSRKVTESVVLLGAFTAFFIWAAYSTWTGRELRLGTILLGSLLSAGALWCGGLLAVLLIALSKRKRPIQPLETTRGK